jgi:hypothetical protein
MRQGFLALQFFELLRKQAVSIHDRNVVRRMNLTVQAINTFLQLDNLGVGRGHLSTPGLARRPKRIQLLEFIKLAHIVICELQVSIRIRLTNLPQSSGNSAPDQVVDLRLDFAVEAHGTMVKSLSRSRMCVALWK